MANKTALANLLSKIFYLYPQLIENEKGVFIRWSRKIHKLFINTPHLVESENATFLTV